MSNAFHHSSTIQRREEKEIVVWKVLLGDCLYDILCQHTAHNGTHWTQLPKHNPDEYKTKYLYLNLCTKILIMNYTLSPTSDGETYDFLNDFLTL